MDQVLQSKTLNQENALSFICFPLKTIPWPRFPHNWGQPCLKLSPRLLKTFTNPIKTGLSSKFVIKSKPKSSAWLQMSLCSTNFHLFPLKIKKKKKVFFVVFCLLQWWICNNSINSSKLLQICTRLCVSRFSRGLVKTKVGSWMYSKAKTHKHNAWLSVNKMQLHPVGFHI